MYPKRFLVLLRFLNSTGQSVACLISARLAVKHAPKMKHPKLILLQLFNVNADQGDFAQCFVILGIIALTNPAKFSFINFIDHICVSSLVHCLQF